MFVNSESLYNFRVYARRDVLAVGTYPINVTGIPPDSNYPRLLSEFLSEFVTKVRIE